MGLMVSFTERRFEGQMAQRVNWRGRSGRFYALAPERLDSFSLGAEAEVVGFRVTRGVLASADRAFAVEGNADEASQMTMVWDLEGAEPVSGLSAA